MASKRCSKCSVTKDVSEFNRNRSRHDGLQAWCRECHNIHQRKAPKHVQEPLEFLGEEWRAIPGYEGIYEASSLGRIRSMDRLDIAGRKRRGKVLRPGCKPTGYLFICLYNGGESTNFNVHSLVARAFIGKLPNGYHVHHINSDMADNRACNLCYIEGSLHHSIHRRGERCNHAVLSRLDVHKIRLLIARGKTNAEIAAIFCVNPSTIYSIRGGKTWSWLPTVGTLGKHNKEQRYNFGNALRVLV